MPLSLKFNLPVPYSNWSACLSNFSILLIKANTVAWIIKKWHLKFRCRSFSLCMCSSPMCWFGGLFETHLLWQAILRSFLCFNLSIYPALRKKTQRKVSLHGLRKDLHLAYYDLWRRNSETILKRSGKNQSSSESYGVLYAGNIVVRWGSKWNRNHTKLADVFES